MNQDILAGRLDNFISRTIKDYNNISTYMIFAKRSVEISIRMSETI